MQKANIDLSGLDLVELRNTLKSIGVVRFTSEKGYHKTQP